MMMDMSAAMNSKLQRSAESFPGRDQAFNPVAKRTVNFTASFECAQDEWRILTGFVQHPTQCVVQMCQRSPFDRVVVMGTLQFDNAFFSGIGLNDQPVETRRNDFVFFRQQKYCWCAAGFSICDAVEVSRDLQ